MRAESLLRKVLGLSRAAIERVRLVQRPDGEGVIVVAVRAHRRERGRCGRCGRRSPRYDRGDGRRLWRTLDLCATRVYLEADAPRVNCRVHGPTVARVPWARHDARHCRGFEDTVAWLSVQCSKTAVTELLRVSWRTVGSIVERVNADIDRRVDRLGGLRRIGIDEISYKRGHKFLTVVVDHDTGRLVWCAPGRDKATLQRFFDLLGDERAAQISHVSSDAADWIATVVAERCPNAVRCADPFHIVKWANEALDEVRRDIWNEARGAVNTRKIGRTKNAHPTKRVRYALVKNADNITPNQQAELAWVAQNHPRLWRAYRLKEALRHVFTLRGDTAKAALQRWLSWARRCRIPVFVTLYHRIIRQLPAIHATLDHGLSNGLIESTNTKIRLLARLAFGFKKPDALIALAMLALGGHKPALPGRT